MGRGAEVLLVFRSMQYAVVLHSSCCCCQHPLSSPHLPAFVDNLIVHISQVTNVLNLKTVHPGKHALEDVVG